jgi:hypothetical protein
MPQRLIQAGRAGVRDVDYLEHVTSPMGHRDGLKAEGTRVVSRLIWWYLDAEMSSHDGFG